MTRPDKSHIKILKTNFEILNSYLGQLNIRNKILTRRNPFKMHILFLIFLVGCNLASTEKKFAQLEEVRLIQGLTDAVQRSQANQTHKRTGNFQILRCAQNVVIWQNMDLDQKKFLTCACHCLKLGPV